MPHAVCLDFGLLFVKKMGRAADHSGPGAHVPACKKRSQVKKMDFWFTSGGCRLYFWGGESLPENSLPMIFDIQVHVIPSMPGVFCTT